MKYLLVIMLSLPVILRAQDIDLSGRWVREGLTEVSGSPLFTADSVVVIKQLGSDFTFERINYQPDARSIVEKTTLDKRVSTLSPNGATKSIELVYEKADKTYLMTNTYSKPNQPEIVDFTVTQKWFLNTDGNLVRWMISPDTSTIKALYRKKD